MHPVLLISVLACMLLGGCRRSMTVTYSSSSRSTSANTLVDGTFIIADGSWQHQQGGVTRKFSVNQSGNKVTWSLDVTQEMPHGGNTSTGTGSEMEVTPGATPWFIYVETPERLWFFDGKDDLYLQQTSVDNTNSVPAISNGKAGAEIGRVPDELIPRLPENLQKLFPKPDSSSPRPSI